MNILPPSDRNFTIVGPTRCGKSVLARQLLYRNPQVVVVNPKHDWKTRKGDYLATNLSELEKSLDKMADNDYRHVVYNVPTEHLQRNNSHELDKVAEMVYYRENTILYYDELYFVAGPSDFEIRSPWFFRSIIAGNGKGVGVWGCVQRPTWIPLAVLSETTMRATFNLRKRTDRSRMEELLGEEIPWGVLKANRHSFVIGDDMETSPPLKLQLPKGAL